MSIDESFQCKKRKTSTPPDGYVCISCGKPGHWIQQCTEKAKKRKKKKSNHIPKAGIDPSQQDIEDAKSMQKLKPPNCYCGKKSRVKKVKRSKEGGEHSRAIGKYFFFCASGRDDDVKCRFAKAVEDYMKPKNEIVCTYFERNGSCKKGDKCLFLHRVADSAKKGSEGEAPSEKEADAKKEDDA